MKVLVVDDDPVGRVLAGTVVQTLGHEVRSANDGQHAWTLLEQEHFDVLITDREMPRLDGLTLCERVRARDAASRDKSEDGGYCYVVILTGSDRPEQAYAGISAGADDYLTKPLNGHELRLRLLSAQRVTDLHRQLTRQHRQLNAIGAAQHALARQDALTLLPNRLALQEHLDRLDANLRRYGRGFSLGVLDIDHFKSINDVAGHAAGDDVLRRLAGALRDEVRETDGLYRYGGEEFVHVIETPSASAALAAVTRLRAAARALQLPHAGRPGECVTLSAGVATSDSAAASSSRLLEAADAALYQAKRHGRDQTVQHRPASGPVPVPAPDEAVAVSAGGDRPVDRPGAQASFAAVSDDYGPLLDPAQLRRMHQLGREIGRDLPDEIVQTWLRQSQQAALTMQAAVRSGDAAALGRAAHTLKGSSGTVGAAALAAVCLDLEDSLPLPESARRVRQVCDLLAPTNEALQQQLRALQVEAATA